MEEQKIEFLNVDITFLSNIRNQCAIAALLFLMLAAFVSVYDGLWYLWLSFGALAFVFVYFAFPHVWMYAFWLLGVYAAAALGGMVLLARGSEIPFFILGIVLEIASLAILYMLIRNIKQLRRSIKNAVYVPLGLWALSVFSLFIFGNISALGWGRWAINDEGLYLYGFSEALLAFFAIYALWIPEQRLFRGKKHLRNLQKVPIAAVAVERKRVTGDKCPSCGYVLDAEKRACPNCGAKKNMRWCKRCEAFVVICPKCSAHAVYGGEKCASCGSPLPLNIACEECRKTAPLKDWV